MGLNTYHKKRNFNITSEPKGKESRSKSRLKFVVQKHAASHLHYDFRLELDGVLKSWAVPKGPSIDPADKRLAVQVEDHPLDYMTFEGTIPEGQYGGGSVIVWDIGNWSPLEESDLKRGSIKFILHGKKLNGRWALVRMAGPTSRNWLLIKEKDNFAEPGKDILKKDRSVKSGKTVEEIGQKKRVKSKRLPKKVRSKLTLKKIKKQNGPTNSKKTNSKRR